MDINTDMLAALSPKDRREAEKLMSELLRILEEETALENHERRISRLEEMAGL